MFKPVILYLGIRYIFSNARDGFISFVSFSAIAGLSLGVAILITVCSVMNGFDQTIQDKLGAKMRHIDVSAFGQPIQELDKVRELIARVPGVASVAPYLRLSSALSFQGQILPVSLYGVAARDLAHFGVDVKNFGKARFELILTDSIKAQLALTANDRVTVMLPKLTYSLVGVAPVLRGFNVSKLEVSGIAEAGGYMRLQAANALLGHQAKIKSLSVTVADFANSKEVVEQIKKRLGEGFVVLDWSNRFVTLFKAIAMEKTMMTIVLTLLIIMACFNLLSSLVMMVDARQGEIAILRTMGLSKYSVMALFMTQGCIAGIIGIILGVGLGWMLSLNIGQITHVIEGMIGQKLVSADVYWVDTLPSQFLWQDVMFVVAVAFGLCLLATIYPAFKAARLSPSQVLRAKG